MRFPSPQLIWREIRLKWHVRKLESLHGKVLRGEKRADARDRKLVEKVQVLMNKEEAWLRKVSKLLADLQARIAE